MENQLSKTINAAMLLFGSQKPTTSTGCSTVSTIHNGVKDCLSNLKAEMGFS